MTDHQISVMVKAALDRARRMKEGLKGKQGATIRAVAPKPGEITKEAYIANGRALFGMSKESLEAQWAQYEADLAAMKGKESDA